MELKVLQSRCKLPITRRKSQTLAPLWKTKSCSAKPLSAEPRTRLSSMWKWPKKWSDKNSHSTLEPLHIAPRRSQCKIHCQPAKQLVRLWIKMELARDLTPCSANGNSFNSRSKGSKAFKTLLRRICKMNSTTTPNKTFSRWLKNLLSRHRKPRKPQQDHHSPNSLLKSDQVPKVNRLQVQRSLPKIHQ